MDKFYEAAHRDAIDTVAALSARAKSDPARRETLCMAMMCCFEELIRLEGDRFVYDWLKAAMQNLSVKPE